MLFGNRANDFSNFYSIDDFGIPNGNYFDIFEVGVSFTNCAFISVLVVVISRKNSSIYFFHSCNPCNKSHALHNQCCFQFLPKFSMGLQTTKIGEEGHTPRNLVELLIKISAVTTDLTTEMIV